MKVAILYICTGKYTVFWSDFYQSCESNFLANSSKEYFVFTDKKFRSQTGVHFIFQPKLGWPYDTLMRFDMFNRIKDQLVRFDYIFFLNANMRFLVKIEEDFLPFKEELLAVQHPGYFNKDRVNFTYESNSASLAYVAPTEGKFYFMGGFNGGKGQAYLKLIETLNENVKADLGNGIIAVWHDESHLNRYLIGKNIKVMTPAYGYHEAWDLPFEKKVVIIDKIKLGGHDFLRSDKLNFSRSAKLLFSKIFYWLRKSCNTLINRQ